MNGKPNPTENFLVSAISAWLVALLRPAWYVMRSHMGIQHTAVIPIIISVIQYGVIFSLLSLTSEVNAKVIVLFVVLIVFGYIRNTAQARRRRKVRDWSVMTWSSGESLFVPVLLFVCRRVYQRWGQKPFVPQLINWILRDDFIYYFVEPFALVLTALSLWSIGSILLYYPLILAVALIVVRNDAQLWLYLKAHEIPDGKGLERAVKSELDGPANRGGHGVPIAQIPELPLSRDANGDRSVFSRLRPELQSLLMKDLQTRG